MKYFVMSQHKAGTYLAGNLLVEFGLHNTFKHINSKGGGQQYDGNNLPLCRKSPEKMPRNGNLDQIIEEMPDNSFVVGHISPIEFTVNKLKGYKKILLLRDFNEIKSSMIRWIKESGRRRAIRPQKWKRSCDAIAKWEEYEDVFVLNFNDMINTNLVKLDELQMYLFGKIKTDSKIAMNNALAKDSMTKSSIRK